MSIITVPIKRSQLTNKMITSLITHCLNKAHQKVLTNLERSLGASNFYTPFKTSKEVLAYTGKSNSRSRKVFTELGKLGLVVKDKQQALHPLVYTRKTGTPRLEEIIRYYYLLFGSVAFERFTIPYKEGPKIIDSFETIKRNAVSNYIYKPSKQDRKQQQKLRELLDIYQETNHAPFISKEELDRAIPTNQNVENDVFYNVFGTTEVPAEYRSFRQAILNSYRNSLYDYIAVLLELHIEVFSEQNLVKHYSGVEYNFYLITTVPSLVSYKDTQAYKRITGPLPTHDTDPLEEHFKKMDGVISTTASEHTKEINMVEEVIAPVNMTNEINPIEDEREDNLVTATYSDTIRKENQPVSYHSYNVTTNMNSNSKVSINPPEEYTDINKLKQKVEEQFRAHLKNIDHQPPKYNSVFKYRELREPTPDGLVKHLEENNEPPYIPQPVYPKCNLRDAELSRELYYSE